MPAESLHDAWFLTGPTASGKSTVGIELAHRIGAEIVSMDSIAIYRGMDIGTAKPTLAERREAPHHLIDLVDPWEEFSLAQYLDAAAKVAAEIAARGRQVLFVGGTPLYLKGLLRGIFEGPPADWELRRRLADEAQHNAEDWLHKRLAAVDPIAAARLHPNDARRLIRAIEVFEKTGRPISELQQQFEIGRPAAECRVFVLDWPRDELCHRIDERVNQMFAAGLVDEVRGLLAGPNPLSRTASQAVGYREVIEHLEGRHSLAETVELVQQHTRQLAKRQSTWFRSLSECRFVAVADQIDAAETAERIATE
jgi:tRNA dimethylallyltransferase